MVRTYEDRKHAGKLLSSEIMKIRFKSQPLVLAIPNGGLPVAAEIAEAINAQLDVIIVRKLQVPGNPEAGFGALTSFGSVILNDSLVRRLSLSKEQVDVVVKRTEEQVQKRHEEYDGLIGIYKPLDRDVILVDDGLASGYTMLASIESVRQQCPNTITAAVPTASASAVNLIKNVTNRLVCPRIDSGFVYAVANAYRNWYDVPDTEAKEILKHFR